MPLSRFTQTLPLDWAAAISGEATVPVLAAFDAEPFAGAWLGTLVSGEAEAAGRAEEPELGAVVEDDAPSAMLPLADFLLRWLFFEVLSPGEVSEPVG